MNENKVSSEQELLVAIKDLLKKSGHLNKLQAEMRAKVTEVLQERQFAVNAGDRKTLIPAPTEEVLLVNELVREYLEWNGYLYTVSVMTSEAAMAKNGLLSSLPYLGKYLCALASSVLADHLRRSGRLSTTAARKLFTGFAVGLPSVMMFALVFFGDDRVWSIAIFTMALTINGAVTAGYLGNGLDIAPNFSGTIFGMANTLSSFGGWLSTLMVGELTKEHNTVEQWKVVFYILAGTYACGALCFVLLGSGEPQPWGQPPPAAARDAQPLNDEKA